MKPRKKWEPRYRFGGNPTESILPNDLGTTLTYMLRIKKHKQKQKKNKR